VCARARACTSDVFSPREGFGAHALGDVNIVKSSAVFSLVLFLSGNSILLDFAIWRAASRRRAPFQPGENNLEGRINVSNSA